MSGNHDNWAYCRIETQIQDGGREGYNPMWLQFRARLAASNRIIDRSEKVPLEDKFARTIPIIITPQKSNLIHQNTLNIFLEKLQSAGWELLPLDGGDWWQRRLRHKELPTGSLTEKLKNLF